MKTVLNERLSSAWSSFSRLHLALRIPLFGLAWPVLLGLYVFSRGKNSAVNYGALVALVIFLQIPWLTSMADLVNVGEDKTTNIAITQQGKPSDEVTSEPSPTASPIIDVAYGAVTTNCDNYFMTGTLEVTNLGNIPISGRAELPVSTYEKFIIPLSGVFLDLPPESSTIIALEGGEGCKKGQVVGKPSTVFTIPGTENLETLNLLNAFEWKSVSAVCDKGSGFVRLKATATNLTHYTLTAGIQAYLANGPLSQGQKDAGVRGNSYFGTIYKLEAGKSREIDFGYGDSCIKGRTGFDGPYFTEFETVFTY
jgi:hypothetical protein